MNLKTLIAAVALSLVVPPTRVYGHGGGLNQGGCHRETATGGYHCHRGGSSSTENDDREKVAIVLGSLVLVGVVVWWWNKRREARTATFLPVPREERNTRVQFVMDEAGNPSATVVWRFSF